MGLIRFIKNLRYLFRYNIKEINRQMASLESVVAVDHRRMTRSLPPMLAYLDYLYKKEAPGVLDKPFIATAEDTLHELLSTQKSLVRFGDGEFITIEGGWLRFQRPDERLQARLIEVLESDDENIMIGFDPWSWYKSPGTVREWDWILDNYHALRAMIEPHLVKGKKYYDASVTLAYKSGAQPDEEWYAGWRSLWQEKDIAVICGAQIFDKLENNVFSNAKSIEYVYVPMRDAFAEYDSILQRAEKIREDKLICIIAGPTATVLAYDLTKLYHRRALDVGHLAKDYDFWKRGLTENDGAMQEYYLPD